MRATAVSEEKLSGKEEKPQECAQVPKPDGPGKESDLAHRIHRPG
jgi:hypothetical protein